MSCGLIIILAILFLFGGEEIIRLSFGGIVKVVGYLLLLYAIIIAAGFLLWGLEAAYNFLVSLSAVGLVLFGLTAVTVVVVTKSVFRRRLHQRG